MHNETIMETEMHISPEHMPPPALLNLAVPLAAENVRSGIVGNRLETLSGFPGLTTHCPAKWLSLDMETRS